GRLLGAPDHVLEAEAGGAGGGGDEPGGAQDDGARADPDPGAGSCTRPQPAPPLRLREPADLRKFPRRRQRGRTAPSSGSLRGSDGPAAPAPAARPRLTARGGCLLDRPRSGPGPPARLRGGAAAGANQIHSDDALGLRARGSPARRSRRRRGHDVMKIRPLHDRILVKRIEEEEKTKGGIIIPDTAKEKPQEGRVVAVGSGKLLE